MSTFYDHFERHGHGKGLADHTTHYCPGCGHGLAHRDLAAAIDELGVQDRTVLINPVLEPLSDEIEEGWEGCLSVPGLSGWVPRWRYLRYTGFDPLGRAIDRSVDGFHARVVQHENDHLDGILYPMRIRDLTRFGFSEALFPDDADRPKD